MLLRENLLHHERSILCGHLPRLSTAVGWQPVVKPRIAPGSAVRPAGARGVVAHPDPGYILFYGTLMRGFDLRRRTDIDPLLRLVGAGAARGALFDLGPYPAVVRAEGTVRGEVYAMTDPGRLLPRVDAVECYLPDDPARSEYVRAEAPVALEGGGRCTAWIYYYAQPLVGAVRIPSGDYREYVARVRRRPSAAGAAGARPAGRTLL